MTVGKRGRIEKGTEEGGSEKQVADASSLAFLDDYFEGAGYGLGGAYGFAQGTPVTIFGFDNTDNVFDQDYGPAGAHMGT